MGHKLTPEIVIEETRGSKAYEDYLDLRRSYVRDLVNKWAFMLEGTKKNPLPKLEEHLYEPMAMMLENQQAICRRSKSMTEDTLTTDMVLPERFALPIIRRVFPELFATKIGSIQPLPLTSGGTGKIFFLDFYREADSSNVTSPQPDAATVTEIQVPPKVKLGITSDIITVEMDRLGAVWSTSSAEDAGALNISVPTELINATGAEIAREHDQRIIRDLAANALAATNTWKWTPDTGYTMRDWYETLGYALTELEDMIYANRFRDAGWILCGRNAFTYIRKMQDFVGTERNGERERSLQLGTQMRGNYQGLWDVFRTPYLNTNTVIMGIYPRSVVDTSYIYCPYIPLDAMPLVYAGYDPVTGNYTNTDEWTRVMRTRHGRKMVVPEAYGILTISAS